MKILFLTQTDQKGASARYRVYQFLDYLEREGIECTVSPAVKESVLNRYNNNNLNIVNKLIYYSSVISKRIVEINCISNFDCVFLQRDILVHIYPFIENLIALRQKNIIFDFDDMLALYPSSSRTGFLFRFFWDRRKIERIINLSKHVIVGNNFLKNYVNNFTNNVTLIPTSIDTNLYKSAVKPKEMKGRIRIGWIGSQGTFSYLENIFPVFIELVKKYEIELIVIGTKGPKVNGLKINYKDWNLDTEVKDITDFNIGIMPLTDDEWSRGKSATKLLQYMAAGIPAVASPVGVNTEIINDGINGFLADTKESWIKKISLLIENKQLCSEMVNNARNNVERFYSVQANAQKLIKVIKKVVLSN